MFPDMAFFLGFFAMPDADRSAHSPPQHAWDVTPAQAVAIQRQLSGLVSQCTDLGDVRRVAGVDVGFEAGNTITRAAIAVLDFPGLQLQEYRIARRPTSFPYVPGLLSFRELPAVLAALAQLSTLPDLLLVDGQGRAHPRRLGIACHLGVLTGLPCIGVGKSRLLGQHAALPTQRGAAVELVDKEEVIGMVVCTRSGVKPVYVSIGHRVDLPTAVHYVLRCSPRYRLPEPIRWAHRLASGPAIS